MDFGEISSIFWRNFLYISDNFKLKERTYEKNERKGDFWQEMERSPLQCSRLLIASTIASLLARF